MSRVSANQMDSAGQTPDLGMSAAIARAQVAAQAGAIREKRELRQLEVLRSTYPGWKISRVRETSGQEWWIAELRRRPISDDMRVVGVVEIVKQPDGPALASVLAQQVELIRASGERTWTG